jgi:hypothetical protein
MATKPQTKEDASTRSAQSLILVFNLADILIRRTGIDMLGHP